MLFPQWHSLLGDADTCPLVLARLIFSWLATQTNDGSSYFNISIATIIIWDHCACHHHLSPAHSGTSARQNENRRLMGILFPLFIQCSYDW